MENPNISTDPIDVADKAFDEFISKHSAQLIDLCYRGILERMADTSGLNGYASVVVDRHGFLKLIKSLIDSEEFYNRKRKVFEVKKPDEILFLQTSDPVAYRSMLLLSNATVHAYCEKHSFVSETYIGIKRGCHPWHAAFNRILILNELISSGRDGWAVYMDADAYINDLDFDLREYLAAHANAAMIFAPSWVTDQWWDVNDGVFFINMGSQEAKQIVRLWLDKFMTYSDGDLRNAFRFESGIPGDQYMLHTVFQNFPYFKEHVHIDRSNAINSMDARFIRQFMRSHADTPVERLAHIEREVSRVLAGTSISERTP